MILLEDKDMLFSLTKGDKCHPGTSNDLGDVDLHLIVQSPN